MRSNIVSTILVVEDNPEVRETVKFLLSIEGYSVISAENGKVALKKIEMVKPDLIFSDILMPELDGIALAKSVKSQARFRDIPILLTSCAAQDTAGLVCDGFLQTPCDLEELLRMVRELITR